MIACDWNGEDGPKSKTKPVFLDTLFQFTVLPDFTQKGWFPFAFGILGVAEASEAVRFTSTVHAVPEAPHVFSALQMASGFGSEQRYFSLPRCCSCANVNEERSSTNARAARCWVAIKYCFFIIECL